MKIQFKQFVAVVAGLCLFVGGATNAFASLFQDADYTIFYVNDDLSQSSTDIVEAQSQGLFDLKIWFNDMHYPTDDPPIFAFLDAEANVIWSAPLFFTIHTLDMNMDITEDFSEDNSNLVGTSLISIDDTLDFS